MKSRYRFAVALLALLALPVAAISSPAPAAQDRWNVARFSACSRVMSGSMDPDVIVSSTACADRAPSVAARRALGSVTIDTVVVYSRPSRAAWEGTLMLTITYQRAQSRHGGGAAGFANFYQMTAALGDGLVRLPLSSVRQEMRGCRLVRGPSIRTDICGYRETIALPLTPDLLTKLADADRPGGSMVGIKLFSRSSEDVETRIYPAEALAVRDLALRQ